MSIEKSYTRNNLMSYTHVGGTNVENTIQDINQILPPSENLGVTKKLTSYVWNHFKRKNDR